MTFIHCKTYIGSRFKNLRQNIYHLPLSKTFPHSANSIFTYSQELTITQREILFDRPDLCIFFYICTPLPSKSNAEKTLHKNGIQRVYLKPLVFSKQALPKLCLLLPIVKKCQITFVGKFSLIFS